MSDSSPPASARISPSQAERIAEACRLIADAERPPRLDDLAATLGLSPWHFHRLFKAVTGLTPHAYARARQAERLRIGLRSSASVTDALHEAGYSSSSRFYEQGDAVLGMTPTAWRAGGAEVDIRFALGECALGAILVAESARGICAILLGDDAEALLRELQELFPQAELVGDDAAFAARVARVIGFIEQPAIGLDLPLDIRGTVFQQRVWAALRAIPSGSTCSYSELAERLGMPRASRAVASACAANKLAVAIPCHRVIRQDGSLSGYRWGLARKQALLDAERGPQAT